ncbi:MAG: hypothetical protein AB9869_24355 [Verrucomicrobiia bacterium]
MRWSFHRIKPTAGAGRIFAGAALALLLGTMSLPLSAVEVQKGTPETPSSAGAVAGTFICHDGNAYRVVLTLNSNGTYWARGSSCLKNKGDASGTGTWRLTERRIVLTPSKEDGWMNKEPKVFDVLKFKGDWIFVRADWPDYYNEHGVTDVSCFQRQASEESYTFVTDEELPRLPPFRGVVEQKQPCAAYIKTADGRRLCIGGPGATKDVAGFVAMLKEGQTYQLPKAFLEYQKRESGKP